MYSRGATFLILFFCFLGSALAFSGDLTGSGGIFLAQKTVSSSSLTILSNSGSLDTKRDPETSSGGQVVSGGGQEENYDSRFKLVFQNPSYILEKELEKSSYICDNKKDECKINFKLEDLEVASFSSKFYCENDFGFLTGQEEKCNPKTITFGTGSHNLSFKIFKKQDDGLVWQRNIEIINNNHFTPLPMGEVGGGQENNQTELEGEQEQETGSGISQSGSADGGATFSSGALENQSGVVLLSNSGILDLPNPIIDIQSGLDFLTGAIWQCKKKDCKINLTAENSFIGGFLEKDYLCAWSFSGGTFKTKDTDKKCNPGYIDYGTGSFEIILKIYEKQNIDNFKQTSIFIKNIWEDEQEIVENKPVSSSSSSGGGSSSYFEKLKSKNIVIQSGLENISGKYFCVDENCKINLKYESLYNETCLWDFGNGVYKEKYTKTCNPSFLYFGDGKHRVYLQVFKNGDLVATRKLEFENNFFQNKKDKNIAPVAKIKLQGRLAKYKSLQGNKIICKGVEQCSVNFSGEDSFDENNDKLNYFWTFGNSKKYIGKNPPSIKYFPGKYEAKLIVSDRFGASSSASFFVEVIKQEGQVESFKIDKNIFSNLKISKIVPNNTGKDDFEYFELENIGNTKLNLKGLEVDDIIGKGSKKFVIDYDLYLSPRSTKRFYKSQTKLVFGNKKDEINLIYNDKMIDNLSWDFSVPDDFILTHDNVDNHLQKVFVERVVDGDTVVISFENGKKEKLRLIGVDTPETKHPKKAVEKFGKEAYGFTKAQLEQKEVFLEIGEHSRGKYKRLLGYIYLGSKKNDSFNELLIEKGYARAYLKYPFKYSVKYEKLEKQAKNQKLGLWGNKELSKYINTLKKQEKKYLQEQKKQKIYDFEELFAGGFNLEEAKKKVFFFKKDIKSKLEKAKKSIIKKPLFISRWTEKSGQTELSSKLVKDYEKKLKSSIKYRVSKQKRGLKISGTSAIYKNIVLSFGDKKITVSTGSNGKFIYRINSLEAKTYNFSLYGADDEFGEIFLKNGRKISVSPEYTKILSSSKARKAKKSKKYSASKTYPSKSKIKKINIISSKQSTTKIPKTQNLAPILNMTLGLMLIFGLFLVLRKRRILNTNF